jgi:hypothetical protein
MILTDFSKVPMVRALTGQHSVQGEGHDGTIVEEGNDQDHEGREIELKSKGHDSKTDDNTDCDSTSVDGVVSHTLENDT